MLGKMSHKEVDDADALSGSESEDAEDAHVKPTQTVPTPAPGKRAACGESSARSSASTCNVKAAASSSATTGARALHRSASRPSSASRSARLTSSMAHTRAQAAPGGRALGQTPTRVRRPTAAAAPSSTWRLAAPAPQHVAHGAGSTPRSGHRGSVTTRRERERAAATSALSAAQPEAASDFVARNAIAATTASEMRLKLALHSHLAGRAHRAKPGESTTATTSKSLVVRPCD